MTLRASASILLPHPSLPDTFAVIESAKRGGVETPGGASLPGERPADTARREGREELGVPVRLTGRLTALVHLSGADRWAATIYTAAEVPGAGPFTGSPEGKARWGTRAEVLAGPLGEVLAPAFEALARRREAEARHVCKEPLLRVGDVVVVRDWRTGEPYTPSPVERLYHDGRAEGREVWSVCATCLARAAGVSVTTEAHTWYVRPKEWAADVLAVEPEGAVDDGAGAPGQKR